MRSRTRPGLIAAALLAAVPAWADDLPNRARVRVAERSPIAIMLITPKPDVGGAKTSDLFRMITESLERHTNLEPKFFENQQIIADCEGRIACLVLKVRTDYERSRVVDESGTPVGFGQHLEATRKLAYPRFLVLLQSLARSETTARVSAMIVDTDIALGAYHEAAQDRADWQRDLESIILGDAVLKRTAAQDVTTLDDVEQVVRRTFGLDFRPAFDRAGHWEPFGSVLLTTKVAGLAILIDERAVATTVAGENELLEVVSGTRRIGLEHPEYEPFSATVVVQAGRQVALSAEVELRSQDAVRWGLFWGGAAVAAAGIAVVTAAVVTSAERPDSRCFVVGGSDAGCGAAFTGFTAPGPTEHPAGGGVLIAPLGYSLTILGLGFSAGALLEEGSFPWISTLLGLAAGGTAYAISHAANGP